MQAIGERGSGKYQSLHREWAIEDGGVDGKRSGARQRGLLCGGTGGGAFRAGRGGGRLFLWGPRPLPRLGSYRPDSILGRHLLRHGTVRGSDGAGRGWGGVDGDRRRRAPERPLLAHRRVRSPVPEGRPFSSGPGRSDDRHDLLGPGDQGRRALRQRLHDRRHRPAVRRLDRRDGCWRAGPRCRGRRREAGPGRDLPRLLLGPADEGTRGQRQACHHGRRDRGGPGSGPSTGRAARRTGAGRQRGGAVGLEGRVFVSSVWISSVAVTLASAAIKAAGPILAGGRELPLRASAVLGLLTPALLTALVVTGTFGEGGHLTIDEKALGVGATAIAVALRTPIIVAVVLAAVVTALARLFLG